MIAIKREYITVTVNTRYKLTGGVYSQVIRGKITSFLDQEKVLYAFPCAKQIYNNDHINLNTFLIFPSADTVFKGESSLYQCHLSRIQIADRCKCCMVNVKCPSQPQPTINSRKVYSLHNNTFFFFKLKKYNSWNLNIPGAIHYPVLQL